MTTALWLFVAQGVLGAFDTLYYHEWRARLTGGVPGTAPELFLHGARDLLYALLFGVLPFARCEGLFAWLLAAVLLTEIGITLRDFAIEDEVRRPLGGVYKGERATHAVMGIVYGAALAHLVPELIAGAARPTGLVAWDAPPVLRLIMPLFSAGLVAAGGRDLAAARGARWARFPWAKT